ncbi:NlpC/P60 family protein [Listeria sp. ILCC797]|uniref:C40 family peptidase n=1 Tax=Listeria sp. ILCC797 TaxID=1918333 RepID=UPI00135650D3|nr:NlpC/P60 family protein [Listeria sp. ILCC797]
MPFVLLGGAAIALLGGQFFGQGTDVENVAVGSCAPSATLDEAKWNEGFAHAGVFKGKQDIFLAYAQEQGIDPVLFASIAMSETGWGSSQAVTRKNNPGGLMDPATGMATVRVFPTLDEGLHAMAVTLHNRVVEDGLDTIEKLGKVYAPIGVANDPFNMNANWIPTVYSISEKFGGLTQNCSAESSVAVVGEKISYFDAVMREAQKYQGWTYAWGGNNPQSGFDCSGLTQWSFLQANVHIPRTASAQYQATTRIQAKDVKAGDLIFFKGTYGGSNHISHVGIVIDQQNMYDSNSSGIGYHNYHTSYWQRHFAGYGRVTSK